MSHTTPVTLPAPPWAIERPFGPGAGSRGYRRPSSRVPPDRARRADRTPGALSIGTDVAAFDVPSYLASAGLATAIAAYECGAAVFRQGEVGQQVLYIQSGIVKLSVVSKAGREAVVALLGAGDLFGEGCLAGQRFRTGSAHAVSPCVVHAIDRTPLLALLEREPGASAGFLSQMLRRKIRVEEDLLDQLFNTCEKRLARALLLLARERGQGLPGVVPRITQQTLAEMVGSSRSRVNFFLSRFKQRGFITYERERPMTVNGALGAVLDD
jgi:CRP/FNR family cyclic AMP-dependent transcriptional regulator